MRFHQRAPSPCASGERAGERGLLVLAALLLSACFNPDDILPVKGTITSPEGVEGQVVRLLRESRIESNLSCTNATPFKETTTDAEGRYQFDVFRAQAQKLTGLGQFCFRLETTFASGSRGFTDIQQLFGQLDVPPIPDWRASPRLEGDTLRFEPAAPLPEVESQEGDQLVHRAQFVTSDGGVAWVADDRLLDLFTNTPLRVPLVFEPWAFEDFAGEVRLAARHTITQLAAGPFATESVTLELQSGQVLPLAGTRTPLSRGLECPPWEPPCPLTDGVLTPAPGDGRTMLTLTLPTAAPVSAIVLRGLQTELPLMGVLLDDGDGGMTQVQHSLPTSMWSGASELLPDFMFDGGIPDFDGGRPSFRIETPPTYSTVHLDGGVVKKLMLVFPQGLDRISEVSVFE